MYCPEERLKEDVCDEVHEQGDVCEAGCYPERSKGDGHSGPARPSVPGQPLVHIPGKPLETDNLI